MQQSVTTAKTYRHGKRISATGTERNLSRRQGAKHRQNAIKAARRFKMGARNMSEQTEEEEALITGGLEIFLDTNDLID